MNSFSRMLPLIVRQLNDLPEALEVAVFDAWSGAVGPATRRAATPLKYAGRTLHVATVDETWRSQLERLTPQVIFKINGTLGASLVSRITHSVDATVIPRESIEAPSEVLVPGAELCEQLLEPDAAAIADPELRTLFLRAAGRCLARRTGRPSTS